MMREWKPGDVAMATIYGQEHIVLHIIDGWVNASASRSRDLAQIENLRPLVVIDPEDEATLRQIGDLLVAGDRGYDEDSWQDLQAALREFANPKPPKPEEPTGLGAVVRATCPCEGPSKFVYEPQSDRFENRPGGKERPWKSHCGHHVWADLAHVEVLSEGVQP